MHEYTSQNFDQEGVRELERLGCSLRVTKSVP